MFLCLGLKIPQNRVLLYLIDSKKFSKRAVFSETSRSQLKKFDVKIHDHLRCICPVSVDVERMGSIYTWILADRRRMLTTENGFNLVLLNSYSDEEIKDFYLKNVIPSNPSKRVRLG